MQGASPVLLPADVRLELMGRQDLLYTAGLAFLFHFRYPRTLRVMKMTFAMTLAMLSAKMPNVSHEILASIPKTKPDLFSSPT